MNPFKVQKTIISCLLAGSAFCFSSAHAISITPSTDGDAMANSLIGSGITISPGTVSYIGASTQGGFFSDGAGSIGIDQGIILTSGDANLAVGPNTQDGAGATTSTGGDTDLNALIPQTTNDKNILEFDFNTTGGDLFFQYVFASEEYNEFVNSTFNDVFAFFVDGVNIAIAPDGNPVSINNVNCGNPFAGVGPNCSSFNNNDLNDGGPFFDVEYDGFTDVFTASAQGLGAGTHHIKLAIADAGDTVLDSAVFIKAGSFTDTDPNTVPEPSSLALLALGLAGIGFRFRKQQ